MSNWESLLHGDTSSNNSAANQPSPFLQSILQSPEFGKNPVIDATKNPAFDATEAQVAKTGVLTLRYGDPNMDRELSLNNYKSVSIDLPQGVTLKHWVDQNGYFFWFQGGNDNSMRHYYSPSAETLSVNGQQTNLEAQRLKISEAYAGQAGGFQSLTGSMQPIKYFENMSNLSVGALQTLQNALQQEAYTSNNPYFKIYLADVYVAQAMQPIVQQVMNSGTASLNNPQTLGKIDSAIALLKQAEKDSANGLSPYGDVPPYPSMGSGLMPLSPYAIYGGGYGYYPNYYGYWGGSLDQARYRETALTVFRNLIASNALPQIELPPALPAR
ncbi:MAG TPA: hypothetical protein V6C72_18890 [Chroococcales cyanobacterium]